MIIRSNCFETNSSSTHALCIGKGGLQQPYKLIAEYLNGDHFTDDIPKSNYFKALYSYKDEYYSKGTHVIELRRFEDIGRRFDIFNSFGSILAFIWSCLVSNLEYSDSIKERKNIDIKELIKLFLEQIYTNGFTIKFIDIKFLNEKKEKEGKLEYLGQMLDCDFIPEKYRNKYMYGEDTYGYYPLEELNKIIKEPILFWNLVLGNSKIYTGSDEDDLFEDLTFDNYSYNLVGGSDSNSCATNNIFGYHGIRKLGEYKNGNYITKIFSDGTRTRELYPKETFYDQGLYKENKFKISEIDIMEPEFPESIDLKITNYCNNNCPFCYAKSSSDGKHAELEEVKNVLDGMRPYTEVAIGGGNPLSHPNLIEILEYAKNKNIICNMTVKDIDVIDNCDLVIKLMDNKLITAIGVSPTNIETLKEAIKKLNEHYLGGYIIHLVLGIHGKEYLKLLKNYYIPAILFLGYKKVGNGISYYDKHEQQINKKLNEIKSMSYAELQDISSTISFDNLAIEQLELDTKNTYKDLYQGDDGKFSFYVDAVTENYGKSSLVPENKLRYFSNIDDAFDELKKSIK